MGKTGRLKPQTGKYLAIRVGEGLIRLNCEMLFAVSLLVLMIASTSVVTSVAQQQRVGETVLNPAHGVPGTLVSFQGVGWYVMPYPSVRYLSCAVNGVPVKMDRYAVCEVLLYQGAYEPAGTFVVADVLPGDYPIIIQVEPLDPHAPLLTAEVVFTVDQVGTATSVAATTVVTSVASYTSILTTILTPTSVLTVTATVTTTKTESPSMPQAPDYTTMLEALLVAAVCLVVILAAVILRKRPESA